jgi:predicted nucleic acid-binding protein
MAAERAFLDTSLIVAATVEVHPSHRVAADFIDVQITAGVEMYISPQIAREFLVVLTRQPVNGRAFTLDEALEALEIWTTGCTVLEESDAVLSELFRLIRRYGVHGKPIHDCNIVATMKTHGIMRLSTRNPADFKRYEQEIQVDGIIG